MYPGKNYSHVFYLAYIVVNNVDKNYVFKKIANVRKRAFTEKKLLKIKKHQL